MSCAETGMCVCQWCQSEFDHRLIAAVDDKREDELTRLRARVEELECTMDYAQTSHAHAEEEAAALRGERDALRGVLESIEWVLDSSDGQYYCPSCEDKRPSHEKDCKLCAAAQPPEHDK